MKRPLVGVLATAVLGSAALMSAAGPACASSPTTASSPSSPSSPPSPSSPSFVSSAGQQTTASARPKAVDFAGTVALGGCSGSVIRLPSSEGDDPALVMSNGHCIEPGMPHAGEVVVDRPSTRTFTLLDAKANSVATLKATKIAYATMTDTDISLYELTDTYDQIKKRYGIKALPLSAAHPRKGAAISVVSGYWKKIYSCAIDGFVYRMKEGEWTWKDSVRYTPACQTIGGTSGSPVIDDATGKVVAVNNTGNEDGERCTFNNPCEIDEKGNVTVRKGINYAQQTYGIPRCFADGNKLDLDRPGCRLPRPAEDDRR
ncbi:serine protease [Streptomyces sp. MST-110588]|uniref:S1 family peptidase n=1 Tax=Streptomyces sp. MST-110588 TaxID=2833628 RepID=UPI001F5C84AA|nr:serine protease [Streptomyces sp. MST-110588]UNO40176.1 trypsin-like peptidase domain-containing protein [Streptomyces sp. MST-110588]